MTEELITNMLDDPIFIKKFKSLRNKESRGTDINLNLREVKNEK